MTFLHTTKVFLKRIVLGPPGYPQQCVLGLNYPQREVRVSLHGPHGTYDVTDNHFMVCGAPFLIAIDEPDIQGRLREARLEFHEYSGRQRLLGEIEIQYHSRYTFDRQDLLLFRVSDSKNYCLPAFRLWGQHYQYEKIRQQQPQSDVPLRNSEVHAMIVFYICPRPVVLVTVEDRDTNNIFPMNLMGTIGDDSFAFALNSSRAVEPIVQRAGRVVISDLPVEHAGTAIRLGSNHRKTSIDWNTLAFRTERSLNFGFHVPEFATRVRELKVKSARRLGSHTLFSARVVHDETRSGTSQFAVVHGIYKAWREKCSLHETNGLPIK